MKKSVLVSLFILMCTCFVLSGCQKKIPSCADEEVVALVVKIIEENRLLPIYDEWVSIENIRTQSINKEMGSCYCAATQRTSWPTSKYNSSGTTTSPIEYSVEQTADDGQLYVSVYGL